MSVAPSPDPPAAPSSVTAELRRRLAQTAAVARLGELALVQSNPRVVMDAAAAAVADVLDVELVAVAELRESDGTLHLTSGFGWRRGYVGTKMRIDSLRPHDNLALLAEGPIVTENLAEERRFQAEPLAAHDVVSGATVMIGDPTAPWGILAALATSVRDFDEADRDFLQAVGHVVGDVIARHRAEERARHDTLHDPLTGLPNRTLLVDRLHQALKRRRSRAPAAVVVLNLDDFRVVNDSLGHRAGDELLAAAARRLEGAVGADDTVARIGADTFAVFCDAIGGDVDAQRIASRLTGAFLSAPFEVTGEERVHVTASAGVAVPCGDESAEDLLRDADAALHRAKQQGRGRFELFDAGMRERILTRLRLEGDLRRALAEGELRVHYQPFFSLPDRTLAGFEALVRWEHPVRGTISPAEFIPIAEETGLIVELGTWVLRTACAQLAAWGRADLKLTVNVSARQVERPELVDVVRDAVADTGIDPAALGLEITEGLLMSNCDTVAERLHALQALGVRLVLDDFGTGYSSLSYLKRFPLDALKIDRSFVAGLETDDGDRAIVAAIVAMAKALGLAVVPEGVETEGQLEALEALGCDFAQGFLLGRPSPPKKSLTGS